ncbi:MAG: hypothetical protein KJZ91_17450 [Myxococcales bacterium]|nr:hypothetical protein [Myxococcales bacterium]
MRTCGRVAAAALVVAACAPADPPPRPVAAGAGTSVAPSPPPTASTAAPAPTPSPPPTPPPAPPPTPPPPPTPTPAPPPIPTPTLAWAAALRAAEWERWPGLPPDLRERELVRHLGVDRARATRRDARLGRHDAVIVDARGLRYWLRDRDRVVLVEVTGAGRLGAATPAELLARLGAPAREGPGRYLEDGASTTELVFPGRGIAVTVAESYDTPPAFAPRLAAVQLFARTDLRTFVLELGGNDRGGPAH